MGVCSFLGFILWRICQLRGYPSRKGISLVLVTNNRIAFILGEWLGGEWGEFPTIDRFDCSKTFLVQLSWATSFPAHEHRI